MSSFHMDITPSVMPGVLVCTITGSLDISTSGELEQTARQQIQVGSEILVFNLAGVEYINSQGLSALLSLHKSLDRQGGALILVAPIERVRKIFEVTGLDLAIPSYASLEEAMRKDPALQKRG